MESVASLFLFLFPLEACLLVLDWLGKKEHLRIGNHIQNKTCGSLKPLFVWLWWWNNSEQLHGQWDRILESVDTFQEMENVLSGRKRNIRNEKRETFWPL